MLPGSYCNICFFLPGLARPGMVATVASSRINTWYHSRMFGKFSINNTEVTPGARALR